jgi:hypothetical protein
MIVVMKTCLISLLKRECRTFFFTRGLFLTDRTEKDRSQREGKLHSLVRAYEDQIKDLANKIGKEDMQIKGLTNKIGKADEQTKDLADKTGKGDMEIKDLANKTGEANILNKNLVNKNGKEDAEIKDLTTRSYR